MSNEQKPEGVGVACSALLERIDEERAERTAALGYALMPCPFCGGKPFVDYSDDFDTDFIQCDCGASFAGNDLAGWNSRMTEAKLCAH